MISISSEQVPTEVEIILKVIITVTNCPELLDMLEFSN